MPPSPYRYGSVLREARCKTLLSEHQGKLTIPDVLDYMRDHQDRPNSVCRHPDPERGEANAYETVTSVVMDLNTLEFWISDGPPCENEHQYLRLDAEGTS
jgi:isopenicillin-N N-acyltransferase-like protein